MGNTTAMGLIQDVRDEQPLGKHTDRILDNVTNSNSFQASLPTVVKYENKPFDETLSKNFVATQKVTTTINASELNHDNLSATQPNANGTKDEDLDDL